MFPREHVLDYADRIRRAFGRPIDLLQFHVWEDVWAGEAKWQDTVAELKASGTIKAFGLSLNRWQPENGLAAIETGLIDTVQVIYNVFDQAPEDRLFPLCRARNVGVIARVPLDEGSLGGKLTLETRFPENDWRAGYFNPVRLAETVRRVEALKQELPEGMSLPELALRYILSEPAVSTLIAGMRTREHVLRQPRGRRERSASPGPRGTAARAPLEPLNGKKTGPLARARSFSTRAPVSLPPGRVQRNQDGDDGAGGDLEGYGGRVIDVAHIHRHVFRLRLLQQRGEDRQPEADQEDVAHAVHERDVAHLVQQAGHLRVACSERHQCAGEFVADTGQRHRTDGRHDGARFGRPLPEQAEQEDHGDARGEEARELLNVLEGLVEAAEQRLGHDDRDHQGGDGGDAAGDHQRLLAGVLVEGLEDVHREDGGDRIHLRAQRGDDRRDQRREHDAEQARRQQGHQRRIGLIVLDVPVR